MKQEVDYTDVERPMTVEDRTKWVAALRSGTITQAHGKLAIDIRRCCLGVAMDVCAIPEEATDGYMLKEADGDKYTLLPGAVQNALAYDNDGTLRTDRLELESYGMDIRCIELNFNQIADKIENLQAVDEP